MIRGGEARLNVRQKHDNGGVFNGDLSLIPHELQNLVVSPGLDAAGVDEGELPAIPVCLSVNPVPGDARGILHDRKPSADQLVKQHGLAHIRAAHNGNDGFHRLSHPFSLYKINDIIPARRRDSKAKSKEGRNLFFPPKACMQILISRRRT